MPTETGRSRSRVRVFSRHAESVPVLPAAVIDRQLLAQIRAFTARAKDEWGGLVVGYAESGRLVYVLAAFPPQLMQSPTRCTFANRYRVALKLGLWTAGLTDVLPRVDWLHTHPDLGVFLSPIDNNTFDAFRIEDPQILALVYDPIRDALEPFWKGIERCQQVIIYDKRGLLEQERIEEIWRECGPRSIVSVIIVRKGACGTRPM